MKYLKTYENRNIEIGDYVIVNNVKHYYGLVFEIVKIELNYESSPYTLRCINSTTYQNETPSKKDIEKIKKEDAELYISTVTYNL